MQQTTFTNGQNVETGDAIDLLIAEHRKIEGLLKALPEAAPGARAQLLDELKQIVVPHNATEENIIYPAIHEIAQRPMHAGRLYHQQDEAAVLVWELSNLEADDREWVAKATKLRDAVLAHAHDEETSEFPRLREAAGDLMAQITSDVRAFRQTFGAKSAG